MVHNFPKGLSTFYIGVYKLVDDPSTDSIISLSKSNQSFIVWRPEEFWDRITRAKWEFGLEDFVRGEPERLKKLMLKGGKRSTEAFKAEEKAKAKAKQAENRLRQLRI